MNVKLQAILPANFFCLGWQCLLRFSFWQLPTWDFSVEMSKAGVDQQVIYIPDSDDGSESMEVFDEQLEQAIIASLASSSSPKENSPSVPRERKKESSKSKAPLRRAAWMRRSDVLLTFLGLQVPSDRKSRLHDGR